MGTFNKDEFSQKKYGVKVGESYLDTMDAKSKKIKKVVKTKKSIVVYVEGV